MIAKINNYQIDKDTTIGELVSYNINYAKTLSDFGIDFCCGGGKTLHDVIREKNIDKKILFTALAKTKKTIKDLPDFSKMNLVELINYIVDNHHTYLRDNLPHICNLFEKVVIAHGKKHDFLFRLKNEFDWLRNDLIKHLDKEESIVFRVIRYLYSCHKYNEKPRRRGYNSARALLKNYETDHETAGNSLRNIRMLTSDFTLPDDACTTFTLLYSKLKEMEGDIHRHIHIENNILFPGVIHLEEKGFNNL